MPWFTIISVLLCISLIQTTLLFYISIFNIHPDLFFIFLVYFSLNFDIERSFYVNWTSGLARDFFSGNLFGLNTILFVVIGFLISLIKDEIFRKHLLTQILVTFIVSILYNLFLTKICKSINYGVEMSNYCSIQCTCCAADILVVRPIILSIKILTVGDKLNYV